MATDFARELARYGPDRNYAPVSLADAQVYCSRLARTHYENFSVASLLLPRPLLRHFHTIYAYSRWADDLGDETGGGAKALALLRWWREELLRCYGGTPRHPVMVALQRTIRRFQIPPEPCLNLLFAFEQDQLVKEYRTFEQLLGYCRNSANPVGRLILYVCEEYSTENAALSDFVCTGLQLANFWQDVARDYEIGRIYLPSEDRQRFGYADTDLHERRCTPEFVELMHFEVDRARDFLMRGWPLTERVHAQVQADIEAFVRGGLAILRKIERSGYNVLARRPALAKWEKAALLGATLWRRFRGNGRLRKSPTTDCAGRPTRNLKARNSFPPSLPVLRGRGDGGEGEMAPRDGCIQLQDFAPAPPHPNPLPLSTGREGAGVSSLLRKPENKSLAQSYAYCETVAREKARHFYPAFRLLPAAQRRAMCALYAFMRVADDLADEPGPIDLKKRALTNWRLEFDMALQGRYAHLAHQALHHTMTTFRVPREYLEAVLDGVEMDLFRESYETFEDVRLYCYRVASAVGLASIHVWGFQDAAAKSHAESAGIAFQLTNILRDLAEDISRGRVYLPQEDLRRFGYSVDELRRGQRGDSFRALMQFQVARARDYYAKGAPLVDYLEPAGRRVFRLLAQTYSGLLDMIEERDYDVFSHRVSLGKWRKWKLLMQAVGARWGWA